LHDPTLVLEMHDPTLVLEMGILSVKVLFRKRRVMKHCDLAYMDIKPTWWPGDHGFVQLPQSPSFSCLPSTSRIRFSNTLPTSYIVTCLCEMGSKMVR